MSSHWGLVRSPIRSLPAATPWLIGGQPRLSARHLGRVTFGNALQDGFGMTSPGVSSLISMLVATASWARLPVTASPIAPAHFCAWWGPWGYRLASLLRRAPKAGLGGTGGRTAREIRTPWCVISALLAPPRVGAPALCLCTRARHVSVACAVPPRAAATSLACATSQADGAARHLVPAAFRRMRLP